MERRFSKNGKITNRCKETSTWEVAHHRGSSPQINRNYYHFLSIIAEIENVCLVIFAQSAVVTTKVHVMESYGWIESIGGDCELI